jgi:hypothetical protein
MLLLALFLLSPLRRDVRLRQHGLTSDLMSIMRAFVPL